MKKLQLKDVFVNTRNVRNFSVMMDGLALGAGKGRFGVIHGQAGLGKTTSIENWHGNNKSYLLRMTAVMSPTKFLSDLAREMQVADPPHRKGDLFTEIVDRLIADPQPVFIDEIDKMPSEFLEILRDLTDVTGSAVILAGEEGLMRKVRVNRRVWSRVYQQVAFGPIAVDDVVALFAQAGGLKMTLPVAKYVHEVSQSNFRDAQRFLEKAAQYCQHKESPELTDDMARIVNKDIVRAKEGEGATR